MFYDKNICSHSKTRLSGFSAVSLTQTTAHSTLKRSTRMRAEQERTRKCVSQKWFVPAGNLPHTGLHSPPTAQAQASHRSNTRGLSSYSTLVRPAACHAPGACNRGRTTAGRTTHQQQGGARARSAYHTGL